MDSQVARWEEQAASAIRRSPDKRDEILAKLEELKVQKLGEWHTKALAAVDRSPDKAADIQGKFRELASGIGFDINTDTDLGISAFRNVSGGNSGSTAPEAYVPGFGETEAEFYDRKEREAARVTPQEQQRTDAERRGAQMDVADAAREGARAVGARTLKGLGVDVNLPQVQFSDDQVAQKAAQAGGSLVATLPAILNPATAVGFGLTQGSAGAQETLAAGGSTGQALLAGGVEAALFPLQRLIPGAIGGNLTTRLATGAGIGLATGAGSDALLNQINPDSLKREVLDPYSRVPDVLLGVAAGAASRGRAAPRSAPEAETIPKTGDADIDSGIEMVENLARESKPRTVERAPEQQDLFSSDPVLSVDMFSGESVPASLMEQRRIRQELANRGEEAPRTEQEQIQLERDYILDQQDRLNAEAAAANEQGGIVSRRGDIPDPYMALANTYPADVNAPNPRQIFTRDGEAVGVRDVQPNSQMADEFAQAWINRGQLRNEPTPVEQATPVQPELFQPSRNAQVDQRSVQGDLDLAQQNDLFGNRADPVIQETVAAPKPKAVEREISNDDLLKSLDSLNNRMSFSRAEPEGSTQSRLQTKFNEGTLTTREVIGLAKQMMAKDTPDQQAFARTLDYLQVLGDRFGGLDTKHIRFDPNNPQHQRVFAGERFPSDANSRAVFNGNTNEVYIKPGNEKLSTMVHEGTHAITQALIRSGYEGNLRGPAQKAFAELHGFFHNILRPEVLRTAEAKYAGTDRDASISREGYGAYNMDEMYAEFFSNPVFRKTLKETKFTPEMKSRLTPFWQRALDGAKNLYDAMARGVSRLMARAGIRSMQDLGAADKAESLFDVALHKMDRFHELVDDADAANIRDVNARNTQPQIDTSFLGEQVPNRTSFSREQPENLQAPRNPLVTAARAALAPKGIEPKVTDARNVRTGEAAAGVYRAATIGNRLKDGLKRNPDLYEPLNDVIEGKTDPRQFLSSLEDSKMKEAVRDFLNDRVNNSVALVREVAMNPNSTKFERTWAAKVLKDANSFVTRAYEANLDPPKKGVFNWMKGGYMGRKMDMATKAEVKLGEGKSNAELTPEQIAKLSPDEAKNLNQLRQMRSWVTGWFDPNRKALDTMNLDELGDLYQTVTKRDPVELTRDLPDADKRATLKAAYLEGLSKTDVPQLVDNMIKGLSGLSPEKTGAVISYVRNMRLGSDVMATRENVPPALREWWGEIKNPVARMIQTMSTQTSQLAQLKALRHLRETGLGTIFTEAETPTHTSIISGEKFGPLQGLRTTPDVAKAMNSILKMDQSAGDIVDAIVGDAETNSLAKTAMDGALLTARKLSTAKKLATVVFNQGRWAMNAIGSFGQAATNGNVNLASWKRGASATMAALGSGSRRKTNPDVELLYRYGIWEPTQTADIYSGIDRDNIIDLVRQTSGLENPVQMAKRLGSAALSLSKEGYAATDLWTKAANFFNDVDMRKAHNKRIGKEMSQEELYRFVADRTNNTNITPSRAPAIMRAIEKHGGTQYLPYQFETFRTTANNLQIGLSDALEGARTGDPRMLMYGAARMTGALPGMLYSQAAYHAAIGATLGALGYAVGALDDDDERRKFLDLDPSKLGSDVIVLTDSKGDEYTMDMGQIPPMDPAMRPTQSIINAVYALTQGDTKEAEKQVKNAGTQMANLVSQNSMYRDLARVFNGKEPAIARSNPEAYETISQSWQSLGVDKPVADRLTSLSEIVAPKGLLEAMRAETTNTDPNIKNLIRAGVGVRELNPAKDMRGYFGQSRKMEIQDAKKQYADLLKQGFDVAPELVEEKFVNALKEVAKPYRELQIGVAAAKEQGTSRKEILQNLDGLAIGEDLKAGLLRGRKFPVQAMIVDLEKDLDQKLLEDFDNPEKQAEAKKRFKSNTRLIQQLYKKYKNKSIEEL